jgi:hypothetical protein
VDRRSGLSVRWQDEATPRNARRAPKYVDRSSPVECRSMPPARTGCGFAQRSLGRAPGVCCILVSMTILCVRVVEMVSRSQVGGFKLVSSLVEADSNYEYSTTNRVCACVFNERGEKVA